MAEETAPLLGAEATTTTSRWSFGAGWARVVRGWNDAGAAIGLGPAMPYINYALSCLWDQLRVVVPIVVYLVLYLLLVFGETIQRAGQVCLGLLVLMFGLVLFLEGLRLALMPLGRIVGEKLPARSPLWVVLAVAFVLGVAVTLAEPAIGALQTLGVLVDPVESRYLYLTLNDNATFLVLSIGLGVGVAAVLGILRFQYDWTMKTLIYITVPPTLALSAVLVYAFVGLDGVLGLAWDSGAITTGPVTVPIVLALGIGVATHRSGGLLRGDDDQSMPGFGIVTLASLFPIVAVMVQGMITQAADPVDPADPADPGSGSGSGGGSGSTNATDSTFPPWDFDSPVTEVALAVRAILPLVLILVGILKCLVCDPLPNERFLPVDVTDKPAVQGLETTAGAAIVHHAAGLPALAPAAPPANIEAMAATREKQGLVNTAANDDDNDDADEEGASGGKGCGGWWRRYGTFTFGVAASFVGMTMFNWGLTYGLSDLGEQVGSVLPSAFMAIEAVPGSPLYSEAAGLFLVFLFAFVLGVLATVAEPALSVMGTEVERLTRGQITKVQLILAVSLGVGVGILLGVAIIVLNWNLIYFLFGGYAIALALTVVSTDQIATIAWDSAGVTTGPVTVPFVLSLGVSLGDAVNAASGFGILTMASVGPIIAVLIMHLITRGIRTWRQRQ